MINAQTLQQYFHADYRGAESILSEVLEPIFGRAERNNQSIIETNADRQKAQSTNIQEILNIATLDPEGSDECIKVFDVTIEDNCHIHIARKGIQHLIREWIDRFEGAFIVFHYANPKGRSWRLSYLEKRSKNSDSTSAKRYTYLCGQDYPCRTIAERFSKLSPDNINSTILEEAFSAEALSTEFFTEYKNFYDDFVNYVTKDEKMFARFLRYAKNDDELAKKSIRDYIKKLMGRLVFIQFLQKKAWLNNDLHYMLSLFNASTDKQKEDYLDNVLEPLFFGIFNTKKEDRPQLFKDNKWDKSLLDKWADFPYLNGGLFECDELDKLRLPIPSYFFSNPQNKDVIRKPTDEYYEDACGIFNFFERYNFTIDESDPLDKEVGVDPEMLGKIFENLLEDNKDKGAFYTPKEIVQYMCREALIAYLIGEVKKKSEGNEPNQANFEEDIRQFVTDPEMTVAQIAQYSDTQLLDLAESLEQVKICDPAIGSGAFPMGLLNLLVECREALNKALNINLPRYILKKDIILNNIYGVDIERGAIDIARLRFWLSIVVDLEKPEALPNFDYKFMQGNSLLEQYKGIDLSRLSDVKIDMENGLQISIFENNQDVYRNQMKQLLANYFTCSDHTKKMVMQEQININVKEQIKEAYLNIDLSEINPSSNDQFFLWHTWFKEVFDYGGFDIVIGNPPYIGEKGHREIFAPVKQDANLSTYYMGKMDYLYFFFHLALNILAKGGHCIMITTNYFVTADGALKLRKDFKKRSTLLKLLNLGELRLFDSAPGQHNMITLLTKDNLDSKCWSAMVHRKGALNPSMFADIINSVDSQTEYRQIDQKNLYDGDDCYIRMGQAEEGSGIQSTLVKMLTGNSLLGDICNINQGILTGADRVTQRHIDNFGIKAQKGDGIYVLNYDDSILNGLEQEYIQTLFKNSDAKRYFCSKKSAEKIIYFTKEDNQKLFPNIINHLKSYKPILETRREVENGRIRWFDLWWPRNKNIFSREKIVCPQRSTKNTFGYNAIEWYATSDVFFITSKDSDYLLKYVLALLNSKLYFVWLYNKGKRKGETLELTATPLSEMPIKKISKEQQQQYINIVDQILVAKKSNPNADTSALESQIDELVYDLYGLSEDEKQIVRNA